MLLDRSLQENTEQETRRWNQNRTKVRTKRLIHVVLPSHNEIEAQTKNTKSLYLLKVKVGMKATCVSCIQEVRSSSSLNAPQRTQTNLSYKECVYHTAKRVYVLFLNYSFIVLILWKLNTLWAPILYYSFIFSAHSFLLACVLVIRLSIRTKNLADISLVLTGKCNILRQFVHFLVSNICIVIIHFAVRLGWIRIFTIIYNVLQHYYDNLCSPESWSSLLMSQLAENNRGACALRQSVKKHNKRLF